MPLLFIAKTMRKLRKEYENHIRVLCTLIVFAMKQERPLMGGLPCFLKKND